MAWFFSIMTSGVTVLSADQWVFSYLWVNWNSHLHHIPVPMAVSRNVNWLLIYTVMKRCPFVANYFNGNRAYFWSVKKIIFKWCDSYFHSIFFTEHIVRVRNISDFSAWRTSHELYDCYTSCWPYTLTLEGIQHLVLLHIYLYTRTYAVYGNEVGKRIGIV